jgi:uncharacterized membrane protein YkvA (DUF1232 family)
MAEPDIRAGPIERLRSWARRIKADALTLWYASRHPRTPMVAKALAVCLVVYAFSPIDLIPDFIPVLGLLDDAIILPLGILLVVRLVPPAVLGECRAQARAHLARGDAKPTSRVGVVAIVTLWIGLAMLAFVLLGRHSSRP